MGLSPRTSQSSVAGASRRAVMLCDVNSKRAGSGRRMLTFLRTGDGNKDPRDTGMLCRWPADLYIFFKYISVYSRKVFQDLLRYGSRYIMQVKQIAKKIHSAAKQKLQGSRPIVGTIYVH